MADQRCPMCGKLNPEEQEICLFCEARLKPLIANIPSYPEFDPPVEKKTDQPADQTGQKDMGASKKPISSWLMSLGNKSEEEQDAKAGTFGGNDEYPASDFSPASAVNETDREFREWLAGLRNQTSPEVRPETPISNENENTPIEPEQEIRASSIPEQPLTPAQKPEDESIPEWLSRLGGDSTDQGGGESSTPVSEIAVTEERPLTENISNENIPPWLQVLEPKAEIPTDEEEQLPEWLSQLPSIPAVESTSESSSGFNANTETNNRERQAEAENIDWLAQLKSSLGEKPRGELQDASSIGSEGTPIPVDETESTLPATELPDWLSNLHPEQSEKTSPEAGDQGNLRATDLPSWVQALRPIDSVITYSAPAESDERGEEETSGPLAGLQGVLPSTPWVGNIRKPQAEAVKLQVNNNQQRYAAQLEKMVRGEGQAQAKKTQELNPSRILRLAISVILIAVVLIPIVLGGSTIPELNLYPSEWVMTNQTINEIPAGAPLLLVFDYDPALASELEAAAAPVIQHLVFQGARLALISTNPTGPALGEQFLQATQNAFPEKDLIYTNLGYLAGGPVGITAFANEPTEAAEFTVRGDQAWQTPSLRGVSLLSDFGAVIILTDNADTGRLWIEQTRNKISDTPIVMIISAQAEPMIRPYLDSGQIQGLVTGLVGGKVYEQAYATPGKARLYWDSFGFGILAVEIMIVVGGLWGVIHYVRGRTKVRI